MLTKQMAELYVRVQAYKNHQITLRELYERMEVHFEIWSRELEGKLVTE